MSHSFLFPDLTFYNELSISVFIIPSAHDMTCCEFLLYGRAHVLCSLYVGLLHYMSTMSRDFKDSSGCPYFESLYLINNRSTSRYLSSLSRRWRFNRESQCSLVSLLNALRSCSILDPISKLVSRLIIPTYKVPT